MPTVRAGFVSRSTPRGTLESYGHPERWFEGPGMKPFEALRLEPLASLPPSTKLIWCYLATQGGAVPATTRGLAETLALSTKSIFDGLPQLEELGLLEILERGTGPKPRIVRAVFPEA
jgi:hypothetical protein